MSNRTDFTTGHSLELLGEFESAAAEFALKEEQLAKDLRSRKLAVERNLKSGVDKSDARFSQLADEMADECRREEQTLRERHQKRRARIQRAQTVGMRGLPLRGQEMRQKWLGKLQMQRLAAERKKNAGMADADERLAEVTAAMDQEKAAIVAVRRRGKGLCRGYGMLTRMLQRQRGSSAAAAPAESAPGGADVAAVAKQIRSHLHDATEHLHGVEKSVLVRLFGVFPLAAILGIFAAAGLFMAVVWKDREGGMAKAALLAGGGLLLVLLIRAIGFLQARPAAAKAAQALEQASSAKDHCLAAAAAARDAEHTRLKAAYQTASDVIGQDWGRADEIEGSFESKVKAKIQHQAPRALAANDAQLERRLAVVAARREAERTKIRSTADARKGDISKSYDQELAAYNAEEAARWGELQDQWRKRMLPIYDAIRTRSEEPLLAPPQWDARFVESWAARSAFVPAVRFGRMTVDLSKHPGAAPKDARLALPGPSQIDIPLALAFPSSGSLLVETQEASNSGVFTTLNNIILRLLATMPPGKVAFTIIDPVGLGQNFAGLMHLSDYEESVINRRIWTQRDQIEERLADLNEHIEKVIQMYLRNEYATITEYNEQAGSVAEKYHFVVVADFPAGFTDTSAKRLQSIATSGARCGVFTLIHWDQRQPLPDGFVPEELRASSICLRQSGKNAFTLANGRTGSHALLELDAPPTADLELDLVHRIGKSSIDSNRVEVPFEQVAPRPEEYWRSETTQELRVAIGRTGATKLQQLAIGKGTRQHALFAGKTGSGKSTLFHVIITNLALHCSPEQVEFYLIDFKKGVEFKCYASKRLPHARVIAIESDREFGLSVLQRVDEELKRRGDMFRKLGVQDVAGYKRAGGTEPIPRTLLIIDEFQEFFVDDDVIAQTASLLFDRIVRQGRAFGIHVLLGSQTLGGAYTLARATLGQMVIRVALQCNEADAYLIMDENNSAPRLLSRPGEGIYNDAAGAMEGNSPFQVVWLSDEERDAWLDRVRDLSVKSGDRWAAPIVFEGNAPADVKENELLRRVLTKRPEAAPHAPRCWLGAPNSIKGPTEAVFARQSGHHLLIVGQREEAEITMLGCALLALAAQFPAGSARFILLHAATPGSAEAEFFERCVAALPGLATLCRTHEIPAVMEELGAEIKTRTGSEPAGAGGEPAIFLLIHGLQKFKKLRQEDEFSFSVGDSGDAGGNPGAHLNELICEGSSHGMHLIASIDTFNNVNRFLSRKALSEIEMRVLFQMSANDAASLSDSPKASTLGLHRALFYNEHEGYLETFRPYAMPDSAWLEETARMLGERK